MCEDESTCLKQRATGKAGNGKRDGNGNGERGTGNGNEKREIVLGSSPHFPNEYVTSQEGWGRGY